MSCQGRRTLNRVPKRDRPQLRGQIPAPGGTTPAPRTDPGSGGPAPAPRTDPASSTTDRSRPRRSGPSTGQIPAPCLGAPGSCVLLAARCGSGSQLCPEISPHALPPTLLAVPEQGLYSASESVFCGSGFKSLDGAWLQWCMSLQTPRCTTELGRNLGSVTVLRAKILYTTSKLNPGLPASLQPTLHTHTQPWEFPPFLLPPCSFLQRL